MLTVQNYSFEVHNKFRMDDKSVLTLWCMNRESESLMIILDDIPSICYFELPTYVDGEVWEWTESEVDRLMCIINSAMKASGHQPNSYEFVAGDTLYSTGSSGLFIKLEFKSSDAMRHCSNYVKKPRYHRGFGDFFMNVLENDISLTLRWSNQNGMRLSQWFQVEAELIDDPRVKLCGSGVKEYRAKWNSMIPIPLSETKGWVTSPMALSIDAETYSPNHNAMPNMDDERCELYMLVCTAWKVGFPGERQRFMIIRGDCNEIEGVNVIRVDHESKIFDVMTEIIQYIDPVIITGYNILGYDYPYLKGRYFISNEHFPVMGKFTADRAEMMSREWKSSAYGTNSIHNLFMRGRINIDMLPIVRRDYKLPKYDLNTVSKAFLSKEKHPVKAKEMFKIYEGQRDSSELSADDPVRVEALREMTRVAEYCVQDAELVIDLFEKLNIWIAMLEFSNIVNVPITDISTRGQQIRCKAQLSQIAHRCGVLINKRETSKIYFNGGKVQDPITGIHDYILCFDFKSLYPSIIWAYNICYTTIITWVMILEMGYTEDQYHKVVVEQEEPISYEVSGAADEDGLFKEEGDDSDDDSHVKPKPTTVKKTYTYYFLKESVKKGLVPTFIQDLLREREAVKREMKTLEREIKRARERGEDVSSLEIQCVILDKRQLAIKTSANSMFGFFGAQEGMLPLIEAAMSITSIGRELIRKVAEHLKDKYGAKLIYGDTDSVMISLGLTSGEQCDEMGNKLSKEISDICPEHINIEFEKAMRILCLKKKKYAAYLIERNGSYKLGADGLPEMMTKGIVLARRDNCAYLRDTYLQVLRHIMDGRGYRYSWNVIIDRICLLLRGSIPVEDFVIIKTLNSEYKSKTANMKIFADEMIKIGRFCQANDRIEYVICKYPSEMRGVNLGYKMRDLETWTENRAEGEEIDYLYYLTNVLSKPINQLYSIAYEAEIIESGGYMDVSMTQGRLRMADNTSPVDYFIEFIVDGTRRSTPLSEIAEVLEGMRYHNLV
jgi:DNA polymerase elongation subunit (family B)